MEDQRFSKRGNDLMFDVWDVRRLFSKDSLRAVRSQPTFNLPSQFQVAYATFSFFFFWKIKQTGKKDMVAYAARE